MTYTFSSIYIITPLPTQRKGWSTYQEEESSIGWPISILLVYGITDDIDSLADVVALVGVGHTLQDQLRAGGPGDRLLGRGDQLQPLVPDQTRQLALQNVVFKAEPSIRPTSISAITLSQKLLWTYVAQT